MGFLDWRQVAFGAAVFVAAATCVANADDDDLDLRHDGADRAMQGAASGEFMPLATILTSIREKFPGEVVETEFENDDGQFYYEFHILGPDGRIIEIKVDARTGGFLDKRGDD
jgi:uncharacterized membrane protein YkoI